jgi:nitrate reductase NapE component
MFTPSKKVTLFSEINIQKKLYLKNKITEVLVLQTKLFPVISIGFQVI